MAKATTPAIGQFDGLQEGETRQLPFSEKEIGGELLNILSKGLYTNPLDAIREYVQNSIDADADEVRIHVTGNSVFVLDDGSGMNQKSALQAREFGVSLKSMEENVGFRGIGIYSGFDLCNRLLIRTKTSSEKIEHVLVFKFGEMRRRLDEARQDPNRPAVPLAKLLSEGISYQFENSTRRDESFTLVQLEELSDDHINRLSDVELMRQYILKNLPVKFSKEFRYSKQIESTLRKRIPGYKAATVILQVENSGPITAEKPNIPDLDPPLMDYIRDSTGNPVAYYWACLTSTSDAISSSKKEAKDAADFAGFVYKVKGFTIGDRNYLSKFFTRKQIYPWWTGEIYVITTQVIPTSARDEFEAGLVRDSLESAVRNEMRRLQKIALDAQAERRADKVVEKTEQSYLAVRDRIKSGDFNKYDVHHELSTVRDDLETQKNKASDPQKAKKLVKEIDTLLEWVQKGLDKQIPVSKLKRQATQAALKREESETTEEELAKGRGEETAPVRLYDLIERSGWTLDENTAPLIALIGDVLEANLGINSDSYRNLLQDIETGLADLMGTR